MTGGVRTEWLWHNKRRTALGAAVLFMLCALCGIFFLQNRAVLTAAAEPTPEERAMELELIGMINKIRVENHLLPLTETPQLAQVARAKSEQMRIDDSFSHYNPTFGDPFEMLELFGISFAAAGENLAHAHYSAAQTLADWVNSPGHRNNILNPVFENIGVGLASDRHGGWLWTALFVQNER
ncbi:MAG: CAP domain-containing protein [Oscillospiraceae bacterium]|jgi:uncharacterized protein YkwD|nr:CAP domain-containing protein [Oscillospiraceae bacterium]